MSPKRRKPVRELSGTGKRASRTPRAQLGEIRIEFRTAIEKLKALGCKDSMILVEFWHALDCVNGEE